ncbi:UNVERIFIED_CONTAM: hypothetical protein Cloal_2525 [Acetivibrio alkalicellulosi]
MKLMYILIIIIIIISSHMFLIDANSVNLIEQIEFSSFKIENVDEAINQINLDITEIYDWEGDYYPSERIINNRKYTINKDIINSALSNEFYRNLFIVYGGHTNVSPNSIRVFKGKNQPRYIGYSVDGDNFENPDFPLDNWGGLKINERSYYREPWREDNLRSRYNFRNNIFNGMEELEENIQKGLDVIRANQTGKDLLFFPGNFANRSFYDAGTKLKHPVTGEEDQWYNYVQVIQPPTYYSWGHGWMFIRDTGNYLSVPIAPFFLVADNLYVELLNSPPSSVRTGEMVEIEIVARSESGDTVTTSARWEAFDEKGNSLFENPETYINENFIIEDGIRQSKVSVRIREGENIVRFVLNNPEEPKPREGIIPGYTDNIIEVVITGIPVIEIVENIEIPYGVLSIDYNSVLNRGAVITARLTLPQDTETRRYSWVNDTTRGRLVVNTNDNIGLFKDFNVRENNPAGINEVTVFRRPRIETTIHRSTLGDNPGVVWLENFSQPKASGNILTDGQVTRDYRLESYTESEEGEYSWTYGGQNTTNAVFSPYTIQTVNVIARVYNGMRSIAAKRFKNEIENNKTDSLNKKMYWTSEPYNFDVIRWMCHLDENKREYDPTPIAGRYQRIFRQQNSGDIKIAIESPMRDEYMQAREAARGGINRKDLYDKAVFATDRELQRFDYPIKSGYYFNPAGTYSFKVETVTYKPVTTDTQDHRDIVNSLINSFRYETDIMYIDNNREAVNIRNQLLSQRGNSFSKRPGTLTAENNTGVNGIELVTVLDRNSDNSRYTKTVEEIHHEQISGGDTHEYWKMVMEGYSESGTLSSRDEYRYREYVREGQKMYRITETTQVDIIINRDNVNTFTHVHMPDGNYYIRVWMENIDLEDSNHAYSSLGTLRGVLLDEINITVKGSIYDD